MPQKSGLGRGLASLIPGAENALPENGVMMIPVEMVFPNPRQPRSGLHPEELQDLTASIREHGVLQPLIVTPGDLDGRFVLIAGERRLQAARLAGMTAVPVIVRQATDQQRLELAIIENVQRADLSHWSRPRLIASWRRILTCRTKILRHVWARAAWP